MTDDAAIQRRAAEMYKQSVAGTTPSFITPMWIAQARASSLEQARAEAAGTHRADRIRAEIANLPTLPFGMDIEFRRRELEKELENLK